MNRIVLVIGLVAVLSACSSITPIKPKRQEFPEAVPELNVSCPSLSLIPSDTVKLSEAIVVITDNYALYHECKAKVDSWIEWYDQQKKNYNSVN